MIKKPSFLERLTGSVTVSDFEDENGQSTIAEGAGLEGADDRGWPENLEEQQQEGELPVDMYHTGEHIVIRALIAGVSPGDLDIAITRDMVTIKGSREEDQEVSDEDYYHRELYWGSFSRTILLPEEVLIDEAEAKEKHGLLTIVLPKVDKERTAKLSVKSHGK